MLTCSNCGKPLHTDEATILWQDKHIKGCNTVTAPIVVHRGDCDDGEYHNSAGAVYGKHWHPHTHGAGRFEGTAFALPADKELLDELIAQRWKEYTPSPDAGRVI